MFSSVKDTLPDGSSSSDHGEMMKPRAAGSAMLTGWCKPQMKTEEMTTV